MNPSNAPPSYAQATGYPDDPSKTNMGYTTFAPQPAPSGYNTTYDEHHDVGMMGNIASFSDKAVRHAFIRKVYLILMAQLLVTFGIVSFFVFVIPVREWVQHNSWFYYISYGVFLVTMITLVCCPGFRRKYPWNFVCLLIFTLSFSYMAGTIASYYKSESVLVAAGITIGVCLGITIFAIQTKIDFTLCSGLLFALMLVFFLFGLVVLVVYVSMPLTYLQARILQFVYGGIGALVFSLFLVYDTQQVVGGRRHELSPEEYIYGALQLYLDVVYLFLIILSLFGGSSD